MERSILHIDMNNFYASVECMLNPKLKDYPIAVCGSTEERHGIILAKNYKAKAYGLKTGEAIWQAKIKCPNLVTVSPHYDEYMKFSKAAKAIYSRYTDLIEPYGMDEVWADVSQSVKLFGSSYDMAKDIKETIKRELGVTVSVGVSFNKIFAKLGSDMKKPDAITEISKENFKEKIWSLPASDMLGVGSATKRKLKSSGVNTIGELANFPLIYLVKKLGKWGEYLWKFANGLDETPVRVTDILALDKSCGHGMTALQDLENNAEVWKFILELSQEIGHRLHIYNKRATGISLTVKDNTLFEKQWQCAMSIPTQSPSYIAKAAYNLFLEKYNWEKPIRAITVRGIDLVPEKVFYQFDMFFDQNNIQKTESLDAAIEELRSRFGDKIIRNACLLDNPKMNELGNPNVIMPKGVLA